jgi:hypothetical protein
MFADDLAYVKPITCSKDEEDLRQDLETLHRSYKDIGLTLNAKKTKWLLMTPWNRTYEMELTINGERIDRVEQARYLGIELDTKLSYKNHATKVITKSKQAIGALCRTLRKWAPKSTFERLYSTTVEPILLYGIEAWYPSYAYLQNYIERVKKYAARLTSNDFRTEYPSLLERLDWKPISQVVMERRATLLYHYVTGRKKMPENMITLQKDNLRCSGRLCHGLELTMPHTQLEAVKSSSMNVARRLWNALPADVVKSENPAQFKKAVSSQEIYLRVANKGAVRRVENHM